MRALQLEPFLHRKGADCNKRCKWGLVPVSCLCKAGVAQGHATAHLPPALVGDPWAGGGSTSRAKPRDWTLRECLGAPRPTRQRLNGPSALSKAAAPVPEFSVPGATFGGLHPLAPLRRSPGTRGQAGSTASHRAWSQPEPPREVRGRGKGSRRPRRVQAGPAVGGSNGASHDHPDIRGLGAQVATPRPSVCLGISHPRIGGCGEQVPEFPLCPAAQRRGAFARVPGDSRSADSVPDRSD
jgi:hypothetical protein